MKHTLHDKVITKDGHQAHVYKKRNALLVWRYVYYVSIYSKVLYQGNRSAVIYGWSGVDPVAIRKEIRAWTVDNIYKDNPYLINELRKFIAQQLA